MSDNWNVDALNIGRFKKDFLSGKMTTVDRETMLNLYSELNNLGDALFIPLSRGVKLPAFYSSVVNYDTTRSKWMPDRRISDSAFLLDVTHSMSDTTFNYIDFMINGNIAYNSDQTPLFFVSNTSKKETYTNNQLIFPRIIGFFGNPDLTCRIVLETPKTTLSRYATTTGMLGLSIGFDMLCQSNLDNTDSIVYTYGVPYIDGVTLQSGKQYIEVLANTYTDIVPDMSRSDTKMKIRARCRQWVGDLTTGSGSGGYYYSAFEAVYSNNPHYVKITGPLAANTQYRTWLVIDTEIGPDQMNWQSIGLVTTLPKGSIDPPSLEA